MISAQISPPCESSKNGTSEHRAIRRVLVTGASGYLGRSLCEILAEDFDVMRMDISEVPGPGEFLCASITDREALDRACQQADALVLAHMASTKSNAYDWPDACMDINVKGVALALEAAQRHGIKRVVLMSSVSVVSGHEHRKTFLSNDLPFAPSHMYGMTKVLQECVAHYYHEHHGMEIAVLRPAYILREDSLVNKYGEKRTLITWHCIDPRDIGRATTAALCLEGLDFETFYLMAGPEAEKYADITSPMERLGWNPQYRFEGIPVEPSA